MQTLPELVVTDHIRDLQREAETARLAQAGAASRRTRAAWRRVCGPPPRRLSVTLESIALQLDPTIRRPSYGRE